MKKNILLGILCLIALKGYSQCTDCHDGRNFGHSEISYGSALPPNGNNTLGVSFDSTACGLNYVQAVQNTQTRYTATIGTGFPTHDTIVGLPNGCKRIIKAYLYCEASCKVSSPSSYTIMDTVTNPLTVKSVFSPVLIGTAGSKCWGDLSTGTWRADITSAISGNGVYRINLSGFTDVDWEVDGISMVIIYQDQTATYTGTFVLSDGQYTIGGGTVTYTATGFNACAAAPAVAFMDLADVQNNVGATFTTTENGTAGGPYASLFFQSAVVNTNVTLGQTSTTSTMSRPSDCYAWFLSGLYFQTACLTCTPATVSFTTHITPAPCGTDSGAAKIIVADTTGVTYHWSTGSTKDSIFGVAAGTYTAVITGPGGCPIDTTHIVIPISDSLFASIAYTKDSVCYGDSLTLEGSGGRRYLWSPGGATTSKININLSATTTYTLYTYSSACKDSTNLTLKVIPKIKDTITAIGDTICPHGSATLTATGTGGQVTYKWNTGATTSVIVVSDTVTTTYTVTAYGICDSVKKTMKVIVVPLPKPVISGPLWKCKGMKDTLKVSSATNPTTYVWSNGATTSSIITGNITGDSTIYVTAENSLGCSATDTFHIAERLYPTASINYPPECGTTPDVITAKGIGTGPFTYKWSTGGTYDTISVIVPDTTTFSVTISNGCPITKTITVVPYFPSLSACCNTTISIGGNATISSGGSDIIKYEWLPGTGLNCDTCANVIATPTVTTTYTVTGTDEAGCPTQRTITVVVETPCFNFTVPNVFTPTNPGTLGLDNLFYINTGYSNLSSWSLLIYDRWGKEMFKSTNPTQYWNGSSESGGEAPAGVYYYVIDGVCQGTTYKKDGFVQLIR